MNYFRSMRAVGLIAWALFFIPLMARAQQDINVIGGTNPYLIIGRGLVWAGSGPGNLNNNFIFHPIDPNEGFCLFLANNNPTSGHNITVAVTQTGDPGLNIFTGFTGRWFTVPTVTSFPTTVPAGTTVGINYKTTASAGVTVSISGGTTQAGSPDTVDVFAVQTNQSACGSLSTNSVQGPYQQNSTVALANQFPVLIGGLAHPGVSTSAQGFESGVNNGFIADGQSNTFLVSGSLLTNPANSFNTPTSAGSGAVNRAGLWTVLPMTYFGNAISGSAYLGGTRTNLLEMAGDIGGVSAGSMPAWSLFGKVTNPAANATILHSFIQTSATVSAAWKLLTLSCSAACELLISRTTAQGTTCTALTAQNINLYGATRKATAATDVAENACTTPPTANGTLYDLALGANQTYTVDLSGFVSVANGTGGGGIMVQNVTTIAAGFVTASLSFLEQ